MLQKLTVSCRDTMKQESATLHKTHMTTQTNIATTEFTSLNNPLYLLGIGVSQPDKNGKSNDKKHKSKWFSFVQDYLNGEISIVQNNKNGF